MNAANAGFALGPWLEARRAVIEQGLERALSTLKAQTPPVLWDAMAYALLGGGKRLRPALAMAAAEALGAPGDGLALEFGCALEFVHTYSLVHDDLPAMDDDDLRRGRPTCHKVYGEAMAILAGDALLTEAFGLVARGAEPARARLCALLAEAAGSRGMVGGQAMDVPGNWPKSVEFLESLHGRKTGALIAVACAGGAAAVGAGEERIAAMRAYGEHLGLAFQIADDLIDESGDAATLGKTPGKDAKQGKTTFPALLGRDEALRRARAEVAAAKAAVDDLLPRSAPLVALADFAVERDH